MNFSNVSRYAAVVSAVAGFTLALTGTGCSENTPATPRVTLNAQLGPGSEKDINDTPKCQLNTQPWVVIGDNTHPVSDGEQQGGSGVSVSCTVKGLSADKFEVNAQATLQGQGSVTITGTFSPTGDQSNIRAVFTRGDTGSFRQDDCTVDYSTNKNMGVAAGRVWGNIRCPHATYDAQSRTCLGTGEFRFENCGQ
jgi:hypothetical protein